MRRYVEQYRHQGAAGRASIRRAATEFTQRAGRRPRARRRLRAAARPHATPSGRPTCRSATTACSSSGRSRAACRSCNGCGPTSIRRPSPIREHAKLLSGENVHADRAGGIQGGHREAARRKPPPPPPSARRPKQFIFINADGSDIQLAEDLRQRVQERQPQRRDPDPAGLVGGRAARSRREHRRVRRARHGLWRDDAGLGARPAPPLFEAQAPPQGSR